jgi:DNA-binding transcriptional LysR family regulator
MKIHQLLYFLALASTGSFSAAAEELYISQSSLSKQIIALEKELGVQLIDRSKRKISLTVAGERFLQHARILYTEYKAMLRNIQEFKLVPSFSIAAIPVIAQYGITSLIAEFRREHPEIECTLEEKEAASIISAMKEQKFDLAFVRNNYLNIDHFETLKFAQDRFVVVMSRQHQFSNKKSISLTQLSNENFILFDKGTIVHQLALDACHQAGFNPRIFYASLRADSILGLVRSNSGISLMMEKVFEYHQSSDIVSIPLEEDIISEILLVYLKNRNISPAAKTFVEFLKFKQKTWE